MSAREAARLKYITEYPRLQEARKSMEPILRQLCRESGAAHAHVKTRTKGIGSFVKKLRKYGDDCWEKTTDKVGAQIVTRTLPEVSRLRSALEGGALDLKYKYTMTRFGDQDPRALGYSGVHVQVVVPEITTTDDQEIECEIQLRTQAQDVWSSLEHQLIYKPIIKPSPAVERKVERLAVLVELFDEQMREVIEEVQIDPRYKDTLLLRAADDLYHSFVTEAGEDELSLEVLGVVGTSISDTERDEYGTVLNTFVENHRTKIENLYADYGLYSEFAQRFAYFLFSQPESLVLFERIENKPMALADAVRGTDIAEAVQLLAEAWGRPLQGLY